MKKLLLVASLAVIVVLSGCLSALHPLFTEKDLVFEPAILGTWKTGDDDGIYVFERGTAATFSRLPESSRHLAEKGYLLTLKDRHTGKEEAKYYAFVVQLGKHLFLDYFPIETEDQKQYEGFYKTGFVPMHSFYRLQKGVNGKTITIGQFGNNYLQKLIDTKQIRIRHEVKFDGSFVITAPTEELQQYVIKYSNVDEAYENNKTYTKIN